MTFQKNTPQSTLKTQPVPESNQEVPSGALFYNPKAPTEVHKNDLPHWQQDEALIFVTFRLNDAMPAGKLKQWSAEKEQWIASHPEPWDEQTIWDYHARFTEQLEKWLDAGEGSCALRRPAAREVVEKALLYFQGERYDLDHFVIMPNHAHVLFRPKNDQTIASILHSWKSYTAKIINKQMGKSGPFWQSDYWDRLIRSDTHQTRCRRYILENPEKAHLKRGEYTTWQKP